MIRWNITLQHIKSMICPILYLKIFFLTVFFVFQSEWPTQIICSYWLHGRRQHTTWVRTFENYFEKYTQCGQLYMIYICREYDASHDCMHAHVLWGCVLEMVHARWVCAHYFVGWLVVFVVVFKIKPGAKVPWSSDLNSVATQAAMRWRRLYTTVSCTTAPLNPRTQGVTSGAQSLEDCPTLNVAVTRNTVKKGFCWTDNRHAYYIWFSGPLLGWLGEGGWGATWTDLCG